MCGFAGILTPTLAPDELSGSVRRMIAQIVHRGPDDHGVWTDGSAGIALGFRRLSIIDLSPAGHQPMASASGRYTLAFNGEVYNFADLRRELEDLGHTFRGHSDTEVILAAFEHWGIRQAVPRFIGMFAMAVWDADRRELSLFRDRLGKKPLYVYRQPGLITFGSELKALVAGPAFDRTIDRAALASYLRYLYVPAPRTIFERAIKLPAAHILTVSDARCPLPHSDCYWSLRKAAMDGLAHPFEGDETDVIDELDRLLAETVRCRLYSDVPLGALLSGGVDSSTIVALMQEASSRPVKTYTIGFVEDEYNEARHAARVARHVGTEHTELVLTGRDAHGLVPRMAEIFDEPFADPSQLPTLLVSQLARKEVTVALCGDGGDELFGGYNRYIYGTRVLSRVSRIPRPLRQLVGAGIGYVPPPAWDRARGVTAALLPTMPNQRFGERVHKLGNVLAAPSVGDMYCSLLSAWQHPQDLLSDEAYTGVAMDEDANRRMLDEDQPTHLLDRMMLADQLTYLPDDLLAKVDRASMAVSLEVRAPLLDHRVAEFSWRLPRSLKLRGSLGKWALRQVLYRRVPKELIERPKMGFSVPIDAWLRGPLRQWAEALLHAAPRSELLDMDAIDRVWTGFQRGGRSAGTGLWAVIMFQAWQERWTS
jgi:asparagine synthase (glutamine-hydrolysing)